VKEVRGKGIGACSVVSAMGNAFRLRMPNLGF